LMLGLIVGKALWGDGSHALSPVGLILVDVTRVPFGSKATHDPIQVLKPVRARWKSLEATPNDHKLQGMTL